MHLYVCYVCVCVRAASSILPMFPFIILFTGMYMLAEHYLFFICDNFPIL